MDKTYIGIYGGVNSGKSSLINRLSGQNTAIVSPERGTTTDPVKKLMELDGIGPAVLIDTAGVDDDTALASSRVGKTLQTLDIVDMAVLVLGGGIMGEANKKLISLFKKKNIPFLIVNNKSDLSDFKKPEGLSETVVEFSAKTAPNVKPILEALKKLKPQTEKQILLDDKISSGDIVVLVCPIDSAAPAGRLILPQVKAIRNILDNKAVSVVLQPGELAAFLKLPLKVKLVVTDSQAFKEVSAIVPPEIPLTSFSILFARLKGNLPMYLKGTNALSSLKDGDKVLILESCNHSAITCEDIGRVKLPALISKKSGKKLEFKIIPGLEPLPEDLSSYALAVQCGGCMVTKNQLKQRVAALAEAGVPVSNYGVMIACCTGILPRVTEIFKED
ncbi:MAG: [FeFe] hydrogenase H-cluster maturation GTPase HydF [Elusimicrobia bacterium]|nr:[FeFe] hydrogenase H-cluster maturation GTPase HydF [Elusimicrobiota bacterium]